MKKIIIAAIGVLVTLLLIWGLARDRSPVTSSQQRTLTAEVKKGPLVITVKGSGTIQAVNPNKIRLKIKRQAAITFLKPEGTRVAKDEVVARLNTDDIDRDITAKEAAALDATNKLYAARAALEIQQMDNVANLAEAQQKSKAAELELEQFQQGDGPVEMLDSELNLQTAQSELDRAEVTYKDGQGLFKEGFATRNELEEWRMLLEKSRGTVETSNMKMHALEQFGQPVKLSAKRGALESAKANLEKVRKQSETQLQSKMKDVDVAKMNLDRAEKDLNMAREDRNNYEIKAPVDGLVNYGDPDEWWSRRNIQVGGNANNGQTLLNIPDMSAMKAVVPILEADIAKVKVGQKANITVEAIHGAILHGEVITVPEVASRENWISGNQFKIEIAIADGKDLKTGLSCEAEIVTDTISSAVFLPIPAVFSEGDRYLVYPVKGSGKDGIEVRLGKASVQDVEILSGVEPGRRVFLTRPDIADEKK
ncbi:MAG: efflux RND transporter periplasmic adaptor subunit [Kiritimatiellae bacterium]|nr:efflux RND transporter periplasmic adaptor subunit [Kiritimatiellia bacterium]